MFCDRKISGFANVNRVIARVCGGGTLANMPRLCGALPEAKGKGGGVQGAYSKVNRGIGKVAIFLVVVLFAAFTNARGASEIVHTADSIMTMTTAAQTINIRLFGTGTTMIDWGDGSENETKTIIEFGIEMQRKYSDEYPRTITITGKDIISLICPHNQLTALDVSRNTALISLVCNNNQLTTLDVSQNIMLKKLYCSNNLFTAEALNALFATLPNNEFVKEIHIFNNPGSFDSSPSIAEVKGWQVFGFRYTRIKAMKIDTFPLLIISIPVILLLLTIKFWKKNTKIAIGKKIAIGIVFFIFSLFLTIIAMLVSADGYLDKGIKDVNGVLFFIPISLLINTIGILLLLSLEKYIRGN